MEPGENVPEILCRQRKRVGMEFGFQFLPLFGCAGPLQQALDGLPVANTCFRVDQSEFEVALGEASDVFAEPFVKDRSSVMNSTT